MALVNEARVADTTTTTGTGSYTCTGSAPTGMRSFASAYAALSGSTANVCVWDGGANWELGVYTVTVSGGVATIARTTILRSSDSNNAVSWGAGTRNIWCYAPAEGTLLAANNLSDVANAATARSNLAVPGLAVANIFTLLQTIHLAGSGISPAAATGLVVERSTAGLEALVSVIGAADSVSEISCGDPTNQQLFRLRYHNSAHGSQPNWLEVYFGGTFRMRWNNTTLALENAAGAKYDAFPAGTKLPFVQAAPPAGWSLDTSVNDACLRISSSAGGGTGGTVGVSANNVTQGTVITIAQMPAHDHAITNSQVGGSGGSFVGLWDNGTFTSAGSGVTGSRGGDAAHTHPLSIVKYYSAVVGIKA